MKKTTTIKPKVAKKTTKYSPIHLFVFFGFNYPHDFIEKVWGTDNIGKHMKEKFNNCYRFHGSYSVMNAFYSDLSAPNRKLLETYILKNYKG